MRRLALCLAAAAAFAGPLAAETFSIERGDARPFRIHASKDETKGTYALMRTLAAEVKRVTGVEVQVLGYAPAFAGDF